MHIRWTAEASDDLEQISLRIAENSRAVALKTVRIIFERIEQLALFPRKGRIGREPDTRELVISPLPWIVVYRAGESAVEILRIWHGAQDRP